MGSPLPPFSTVTLTLREAARGERAVSKRSSAPTHTTRERDVRRDLSEQGAAIGHVEKMWPKHVLASVGFVSPKSKNKLV